MPKKDSILGLAWLTGRYLGYLALAFVSWGELGKLSAKADSFPMVKAGDGLRGSLHISPKQVSSGYPEEGYFVTGVSTKSVSHLSLSPSLSIESPSLPRLLPLPTEAVATRQTLEDLGSSASDSSTSSLNALEVATPETATLEVGILQTPVPVTGGDDLVAPVTAEVRLETQLEAQRVDNVEVDDVEVDVVETEEEADVGDQADEDGAQAETGLDEELGILRVRSQELLIDDELGLIRIQELEQLPVEQLPQPPTPTLGFVTGRANFLGGTNPFRLNDPLDDQVFQVGTGFYLVPKLGQYTDLVLGVEGNLVRYNEFPSVDYNELQLQAGIRQRISKRVYGQLTWRNQNLYTPNGGSFFSADFVELLVSRRDILSSNIWLDSYYQARVSFSHPDRFSRFSQLGILSLNYGFTPQFRTTLIYQLFLDDYTQIRRNDLYHQVIGQITYDVTPNSRINLFGGVKFGSSTDDDVNFEEVIYGASFNFNVPVF